MEEIRATKDQIRTDAVTEIAALSKNERTAKIRAIGKRLFEFANFLESRIVLMYVGGKNEIPTGDILKLAHEYGKIVVLPAFDAGTHKMNLMKVDYLEKDLRSGPRGVSEPDPDRCKRVPIDKIDIAIIPGIAFDEKGARIGTGQGYYDRLIPRLSITTRKVALAFEEQIVPQIPMESHDKFVDIIITDKRIIYKI
jgi:5-formyltetrahydrofolate cyclo-ligase